MYTGGTGNPDFIGSGTSLTDVGLFAGDGLEIDFTASGRGTVEFSFLEGTGQFSGNEFLTVESDFIRGRSNNEYEFGVELPEGELFNIVEISTTGSLEISIVGITLGTNFESGFDPFVTI
jgi:hypothetical protein